MALEDLLNPQFGTPIVAGKELRYMCPLCGSSKQKLFVNNDPVSTKYGQWICFNCGESGNLTSLLMRGLHIAFQPATQMIIEGGVNLSRRAFDETLSNNENIMLAIANRSIIAQQEEPLNEVEIPSKPAPPLPYGLKYFRQGLPDAQPFFEYLEKRGFSRRLVTALGYGYIVDGYTTSSRGTTMPIHNHVVFFTYDNSGKYLYWNTRSIDGGIPKSINAPNTLTNEYLGKGDIVYNANEAFKQPVVILTEGVPDALTLFPYGVATFGKQITSFQKAILAQQLRPEQRLYVMLDMDAKTQLVDIAKELYQYHEKTYMVFNPTRKDANALGTDAALNIIKNYEVQPNPQGIMKFNLMYKQM